MGSARVIAAAPAAGGAAAPSWGAARGAMRLAATSVNLCRCCSVWPAPPRRAAAPQPSGLRAAHATARHPQIDPCAKPYAHDWAACSAGHPGERAARRCPRQVGYRCAPSLPLHRPPSPSRAGVRAPLRQPTPAVAAAAPWIGPRQSGRGGSPDADADAVGCAAGAAQSRAAPAAAAVRPSTSLPAALTNNAPPHPPHPRRRRPAGPSPARTPSGASPAPRGTCA
jgi:hypothetical protein